MISSTELEIWLRNEIARATGFTPGAIDLNAHFDELGIDSLAFTDIFQRLTKHFPAAGDRAKKLFTAKSIAAFMQILHSEPEKSENRHANVKDALAEASFFKKLTEAKNDVLAQPEAQCPLDLSVDLLKMRERIFAVVRALKAEKKSK